MIVRGWSVISIMYVKNGDYKCCFVVPGIVTVEIVCMTAVDIIYNRTVKQLLVRDIGHNRY